VDPDYVPFFFFSVIDISALRRRLAQAILLAPNSHRLFDGYIL
jgi:hypothetical protein